METTTAITFQRPTPKLLSMNDRHHWRRRSSDVKHWRTAAWAKALDHGPQPPAMVVITLDVPDARRRDPANYYATVKPIVDGLVDAGWWPDDTPEYVTTCEPLLNNVRRRIPLYVTIELRPR